MVIIVWHSYYYNPVLIIVIRMLERESLCHCPQERRDDLVALLPKDVAQDHHSFCIFLYINVYFIDNYTTHYYQ